ncbi:hypothetical protein A2715_01720 [Candidatus Woesebacteria bacterium RIFCSPHIGHO2_01_FULL_39_32]|uniref:Phosphoribosyltransferase n=2 Tax=Candidatus Woeseibacteriota TaxID=1752722 RepID=A0A0G0PS38_9BACT|nr:MAG: Phosphoribosyltransferase [Candidatus Woesebacteria bacterium GW2011_GWA1_39_8]OGM23877.1 MAG: hypothetical protein A2715_01720 [Candidatus Woesebacteria bacterium RIFCSPHIGHO2_01_FULL_39_32]OGM38658.1 MAG: hypothetical protein A3F01_02805 [Candidatus Woesebacteria bacterium RIFCSPHIGHO2_12_FULL_38_11]OGM64066.1 MAG: hypothetical protein A2893_02960 [Candidatus Woesebacteria bacterium RIFCSPLOWO2_01_FULL_39_25]
MVPKIFNVKITKRYNPKKKRKFKITFTGDGIENKVEPSELKKVVDVIVSRIPLSIRKNSNYIVARDRPGIILAVALSLKLQKPLKVAYKYNLDLPVKISLFDPYIPDEPAYLYNIETPNSIMFIDDEILTGETASAAIKSLKNQNIVVKAFISYIECANFNARKKLKKLGTDLISYHTYELSGEEIEKIVKQ